MADLIFKSVRKEFAGGVVAVEDFNLTVPSPRMVVLVGPSGCGKTTLLRMIAGLEQPTSGSIHLGDARLDTMQPRHRDIAMVFQSYALYPHMTVAQNLSFGLRVRKMPRAEVERRVVEIAKTLELDALLRRKPAELSGGQRQRVALGRAIVREPRVFLFDEPLSNLDARLRTEMRGTIRRLYDRLRVTSVYVTHDQVEAMTIGDLLVIMNQGRIHQVGGPEACYRRPLDTFVASFLGSPAMNFADGRGEGGDVVIRGGTRFGVAAPLEPVLASRPGAELRIGIRPEDIHPAAAGLAAPVALRARVVLREPLGHETLTHLEVGGVELVARGAREFVPAADESTEIFVDAGRVHIFWKENGRRIDAAPEPAAAGVA
ncbi:MAG: sn-glycerol-3-phosphate ABC transporter ATP-binding protein UgpC [Candidatus Krumholzibacteria bacterium]|nr:sn-glycerol-3-phosphate ABC transporter ATP-binding protein UgpC [Candidatus Krumholzibacteria bacterium]MDH4335902.1 sn-glycerol-3-phosphate ABC transporter ATP-binding protein UgpC [Candidatus Krumholzibacteria bacterium]MDH5268522.1 sn-glycerol-3-phosphate ABC transporter ATP-binding protein UgpC [Candidatus Krumholzibacteria bacterium]MDH5627895.1 sn-glycerol-3-phosphate ABC transporter ATP-binding protein UgpC [Candidatus Krumholzibacteria bacterium]